MVYAARDEKLDRAVAIKVLRCPADAAVRHRILDEARKAAALVDPGVVTVYSVLDDTDPPALVMEWADGLPLDRFAEHLPFEQKARVLRELARTLTLTHARGLVHWDLKPDDVLVGSDMRPRILDFGLALSLEEARRLGGGFQGTPLYASPEQALGKPLTPAADVFSFGSLMFKVLTGRAPFQGTSIGEVLEAIAMTAPPFLREVAAVLTVWLLRDEIGAPWRWLLPSGIALVLLAAGHTARRASETLAAATFLAGAALTVAPATLSLLAEGGVLIAPAPGVTQLFANTFTNQQLLAASLTALAVSVFGLL